MDNMEIYNKVREVPDTAKKPIQAGRLKGMTDINPMWRIKTLTEQFGACGIGWYYEIVDRHLDPVPDSKEIVATVEIKLYVKVGDEWSKPISGIGGSKIASMERNGLYVDDEVYKKASTDALSVACKNLGIGADVYWNSDNDKYIDKGRENFNNQPSTSNSNGEHNSSSASMLKEWRTKIEDYAHSHGMTVAEIMADYHLKGCRDPKRLEEVYNDLTGKNAPIDDDVPNFAEIDEQVPWKE